MGGNASKEEQIYDHGNNITKQQIKVKPPQIKKSHPNSTFDWPSQKLRESTSQARQIEHQFNGIVGTNSSTTLSQNFKSAHKILQKEPSLQTQRKEDTQSTYSFPQKFKIDNKKAESKQDLSIQPVNKFQNSTKLSLYKKQNVLPKMTERVLSGKMVLCRVPIITWKEEILFYEESFAQSTHKPVNINLLQDIETSSYRQHNFNISPQNGIQFCDGQDKLVGHDIGLPPMKNFKFKRQSNKEGRGISKRTSAKHSEGYSENGGSDIDDVPIESKTTMFPSQYYQLHQIVNAPISSKSTSKISEQSATKIKSQTSKNSSMKSRESQPSKNLPSKILFDKRKLNRQNNHYQQLIVRNKQNTLQSPPPEQRSTLSIEHNTSTDQVAKIQQYIKSTNMRNKNAKNQLQTQNLTLSQSPLVKNKNNLSLSKADQQRFSAARQTQLQKTEVKAKQQYHPTSEFKNSHSSFINLQNTAAKLQQTKMQSEVNNVITSSTNLNEDNCLQQILEDQQEVVKVLQEYREIILPNNFIMIILMYNMTEYPKYQRISAAWHCRINDCLDEYTNSIENSFLQSYSQYLNFVKSYNNATPIFFCKQTGTRLDRIIQCEIRDNSSLIGNTLKVGLGFEYIKKQVQKSTQAYNNNNRYYVEHRFDIVRQGQRRVTWIHLSDDLQPYSQNEIQISPGDIIEIAVCIFNMNGLIDISSLEWDQPKILSILSNEKDPLTYNRDIKIIQQKDDRRVKVHANTNRICEIEDAVVDWIKIGPLLRDQPKLSIYTEIYNKRFSVISIHFNELDQHFNKIVLQAIKKGTVEEHVFGPSIQIIIKGEEEEIQNEIKKKGVMFDRNKDKEVIQLRIGDILVVYNSKIIPIELQPDMNTIQSNYASKASSRSKTNGYQSQKSNYDTNKAAQDNKTL